VLVEPSRLLQALQLPATSAIEFEPTFGRSGSVERASVSRPGAEPLVVLLRAHADPEQAENHLAVMEALTNLGFPNAPRLLAAIEGVAVESWVEGATALALVPRPGACEAAIDAIAALHELPTREGLDWGRRPEELFPDEDLPLHRLGFSAAEREPARSPLAGARTALLASPFGFAHGDCTAASVLLGRGQAWLTGFEAAGFGPQFLDVAGFLLTSGLESAERRSLAERYAGKRGFPPDTADIVDLLGIPWGIGELLRLPRRLITAFGDDASVDTWKTAAGRIERGIRTPAGSHPVAAAIRAALWPS
jgi:hypothetical protein